MIYHTGNLANDRVKDSALDATAKKVLERFEAGEIHLVQKRTGPGLFEYHMTERPRR